MRNKIWVSVIILIIAIITISCEHEMERNTVGSNMSINDDVENNSEDDMEDDSEDVFEDDSEDDFEDDLDYTTDEYFIKMNSVYRNPIEQYFWSKLNSKDTSDEEYSKAQREYQTAWEAEYQNLMKWMKKKCVYDEDTNNLSLLDKSVADQIDREKKVLETDSTNDRLTQLEGELYRDVCMRILDVAGYEDYKFMFSKSGGELAYTDEKFIKEYSIYKNPIDQSFLSKLNSWGKSEVEYRENQREYHKAWKAEFQSLMEWMKKKCVSDEEKNNLSLLEKSVEEHVKREKQVLKTDLIDVYKINPDMSKVENSVSRSSYVGNGTDARLTEIEGGLYRDVCMRILNLVGYDEYEFRFGETKLGAKDIKNIMLETDSEVKQINNKLNDEFYKDYYDKDVLRFRYFSHGDEQESYTQYDLYYNEQGKLIYADITHYRGAMYSIYFYEDELLHVEVGPFFEGGTFINGDMEDVKVAVKMEPTYNFVLEDNALCLENAYK